MRGWRAPGCELNDEGHPRFCDELASDVAGTSYMRAAPDPDDNFYFVVAYNSEGLLRDRLKQTGQPVESATAAVSPEAP